MPKFTKMPVTIEAVQLPTAPDHDAVEAVIAFMGEDGKPIGGGRVEIATLEGTMTGEPGDWLIRGLAGELYPCKPDIFARSYMEADLLPPPKTFRDDLQDCINRWSQENGSDTPDFMLADYLVAALRALDDAINSRERWYGRKEAALPVGAGNEPEPEGEAA